MKTNFKRLYQNFKMSGLLNRDQEVLDALDIRLEPKYNSDIVQ